VKAAVGILAITAILLTGCGSAAPSESTAPLDYLDAALRWADSTTETCADWNGFSSVEQGARAAAMLTSVRNFDRPGGATPNQVSLFAQAVSDVCSGRTDCEDPDVFCDTDKMAEAAVAAYTSKLQQFRP
jgi:hypothetical protein